MMKKKIVVLTATRAEYGLLSPIIKKLNQEDNLDVHVVATGAHLSPEFGLTYREIEQDGVRIDKKIDILLSSDTAASVSKTMGLATISFADYFEETKPDALLVLGDRYETLAVCCAAMVFCIPIFHLYGGDTTEGAIDEAIRHSITKMSYLHFTSTETYRKRVIQLGEMPERVYNVGAIGIENARTIPLLTKEELEESLAFSLAKPYVLVTFHPVTLEAGGIEAQCMELIKVMEDRADYNFIITKANADSEGCTINQIFEEYAHNHTDRIAIYDSLGMRRYLSTVKYTTVVMGNSSSGIVEVPSFGVPTINIGNRQRGRLSAKSVIHCSPDHVSIENALKLAESEEFRKEIASVKNPYEKSGTSSKIVSTILETLKGHIDLKKKFYDLEY